MKLFPMFLELQISIDSVGGTFRFHHNIWFDLFSPNKKNMRRDSKFPFTSIFWEGFSVHPGHWWLICALFNGSSFWSQRDFRESRSAFFFRLPGCLETKVPTLPGWCELPPPPCDPLLLVFFSGKWSSQTELAGKWSSTPWGSSVATSLLITKHSPVEVT